MLAVRYYCPVAVYKWAVNDAKRKQDLSIWCATGCDDINITEKRQVAMALTIAMPLSGLEPEHFYALGARLLYDRGVKSLSGVGNTLAAAPGPISPSSGSETSGISSLATSGDTPTPTATPAESRPTSPEDTKFFLNLTRPLQYLLVGPPAPKIVYENRDLLNLAANIRGPGWPILHPSLPRDNPSAFMENRSLYYRLGEHGLVEEYPTRCCGDCNFCEPSPILSF